MKIIKTLEIIAYDTNPTRKLSKMAKSNVSNIHEEYIQLCNRQVFVIDELDYSILEHHKPNLQKLAEIISVFDNCKNTHVFYSSSPGAMLGYSPNSA